MVPERYGLSPAARRETLSAKRGWKDNAMCGICGVVGADRAAEKRVRKMMNALVHRGPDDEGILARPSVVFGVRRLSIVDLSGGHQPIYNETGDAGVVFN